MGDGEVDLFAGVPVHGDIYGCRRGVARKLGPHRREVVDGRAERRVEQQVLAPVGVDVGDVPEVHHGVLRAHHESGRLRYVPAVWHDVGDRGALPALFRIPRCFR